MIVEYNPFHNGHFYHLQQSVKITQSDAVVAVMSGNFLQRGEPALTDKWTRAEMALAGGCDLVIELPVAYSTQAAEWFAYGAVKLLDATGVVDTLCFGSESGEIDTLVRVAKAMASETPDFRQMLDDALSQGQSYPAAYSSAVRRYMADLGDPEAAEFALEQPNNTLGLHYLLALERLRSPIVPYTIKREKAGYSQTTITDTQIASATAIRKVLTGDGTLLDIKPFVPLTTYTLLEREFTGRPEPMGWQHYEKALFHRLVSTPAAELALLHEITEGLEHRIKHALPKLTELRFDVLLESLKTKRYTRTKLQRALLSALLGHQKQAFTRERLQNGVQYIRVLGFNDKGRKLLGRMRKEAKLPVLLSAADASEPYPYLALDVQATSVYELERPGASARTLYRDYYEKPIMRSTT
nr:nucleotidyltransferase [Paenibacillus phyllosphaerae]